MNNKRFSNAAKTYDLHAAPQKELAKRITDLLPALVNPRILEIGSGTGVLTRRLIEIYPASKIHAIDIADDMVEFCKREFSQFDNVSWEVADVESYQDNCEYDLISSSASLHWAINIFDTLSNIYNHLKPGGYFILGMMLKGTLSELRKLRKNIAPNKGDGPILPSKKEMDTYIHTIGFDIIKNNHTFKKIEYKNTQTFFSSIHEQGVTPLQKNDFPLNRSELIDLISCYQKSNAGNNCVYATYETAGYLLKKPLIKD